MVRRAGWFVKGVVFSGEGRGRRGYNGGARCRGGRFERCAEGGSPMNVKDTQTIKEKFVRRTGQAGPDYQAGVQNPAADWATATKAAEANFEAGVQAAIAKKRFGAGVTRAGTAKYQEGARVKGVARYPAGVAAGADAYAAGFEAFANALRSTTLPPRRARRDPQNMTRVNAVVQAMIKTAESRGS